MRSAADVATPANRRAPRDTQPTKVTSPRRLALAAVVVE